jgi:acetyl esterase/lipase
VVRFRTLRKLVRRSSGDDFDRSLKDPDAPLSVDMDHDSSKLLIAFGGLSGKLGMPPFEFFSMTRELPIKRLFVRDLRQAWYHRGVPGHGDTVTGVAESLRELIARHDVERVVVAGSSAGGYAAILFGTLLGADTVISLGPQTVLDLDVMGRMDDHRYDDHLEWLADRGMLEDAWMDLRSALPPVRVANTRYELYFDDTFQCDRLHAEWLIGLEGLRLYRFGRGGHTIAGTLRRSGALERLLRRALDVPLTSPGALPDAAPAPASTAGS